MNRHVDGILNTAVATCGPLAVIVVRLIGGGADGATAGQATAPEPAALKNLSPLLQPSEQLRAAWAESEAVWARSEPGAPTPEAIPQPETDRPVLRTVVVPPRFVLSAVLGGAARGAAVLDERIYWVGEDLGNGWHLDRVDHQNRTVTLRHESGMEHRIEFAEGG